MSNNFFWCLAFLGFFAIGCGGGKQDGPPQGIDAKAVEEYEKQNEPDLYKDYVPPQ